MQEIIAVNKFEYTLAKMRNIMWCSIRKVRGNRKFQRKSYYGKKIGTIEEANQTIYNAIMSDTPFLAARFGDAELRALVYTIEKDIGLRKEYPEYIKKVMHMNAGFFPADDEHLTRFGRVLWEASKEVDLYGVWYNLLEDYVIKKTSPNASLVQLEALEPYRGNHPWSRALKGKKVLVVHPFEDSIKKQYAIHEKLFKNEEVLPDFELITYKAVQTNAGGQTEFDTWFSALEGMYTDIKNLDFDIAIVGCGAYGLPLAAKLKKLNKKVIHLAGATQILFGIRGARWDVRPEMQQFFNEYWTRPSENEKPKVAKNVEVGSYW